VEQLHMPDARRMQARARTPAAAKPIDCMQGSYTDLLHSAAADRRVILLLAVPDDVARVSVAAALAPHVRKWGRRVDDNSVLLDLTNHPTTAAQTVIDGNVQVWPDMALGLPEALNAAGILLVLGLEQMLKETPHRLAAFLEARSRSQVVVVITFLPDEVSAVAAKAGPVFVDYSIQRNADLQGVASMVAAAAIEAARCATRRRERTPLSGVAT
jgi:hypothetical protein